MLSQQLTGDVRDTSGTLVITAEPGNLAELQDLAAELEQRPGMVTNGSIVIIGEDPAPEEA